MYQAACLAGKHNVVKLLLKAGADWKIGPNLCNLFLKLCNLCNLCDLHLKLNLKLYILN